MAREGATFVAAQPDPTNPPSLPGQPVIYDATSGLVRKIIAADGSTTLASIGFTARVYPFQQQVTSSNYGAAGFGAVNLQTGIPIDTIRRGYTIVTVPSGQTPLPGKPVFVWTAASSGAHIQGFCEAVTSAGNTAQLTNAIFHSGVDANGNCEIAFNI